MSNSVLEETYVEQSLSKMLLKEEATFNFDIVRNLNTKLIYFFFYLIVQ